MDMSFSKDDLAFRNEVRGFLKAELPDHLIEAAARNPAVFDEIDIQMEWQSILYKKGWLAYRWPKEYYGAGWTPTQCFIFDTECSKAGAPGLSPLGLKLVGPIIYTFGTQEQKDEFLPKLLSGEHYWCQGFSEPGSGSDLASLRMSAVRDGDDYIVNGTKIWTSLAHYSNWIFCLVRTDKDVKKQAGISFLLIDMTTSGVEVKPIITLASDHDVNQVFIDNVRVPAKNMIGAEGQGWDIAKFLLANERGASPLGPTLVSAVAQLKSQAETVSDGIGGMMIDDSDFALKLSRLDVEVKALEVTELRILDKISKGEDLGARSSVAKLVASNLRQKIDELSVEMFGYNAMELETARPLYGTQSPETVSTPDAQLAMPAYLNSRAWTIFGGSNEVQKTIIAKTVLGL